MYSEDFFGFLIALLLGAGVTIIVAVAISADKTDTFTRECSSVQGQLATDANTKRLVCIKDGNIIAKYGVNSPKAPLTKVN